MLTQAGCLARQGRFRAMLAANDLDAAILSDPHEIQYLSGYLLPPVPALPAALYIETTGDVFLTTAGTDGEAFVDHRDAYDHHMLYTMNPDLGRCLATAVGRQLGAAKQARRIGWQADSLPRHLGESVQQALRPDDWQPIDDQIALLEKRKDADELALLRTAIGCSLAAYAADRTAIAPGATELQVLEAGHAAATLKAGETILHGGDYRAAELGGFARDRVINAGELYVIDAWTIYRGYWSDLCRTFAVAEPTPLQREIFAHIAAIHADLPERLRPGARGTDIWAWIDGRLREHPHLRATGLIHHAGHGVGMRGHEAPDLNRNREGILEPGDVVSVEPGAYSPELNGGIRLENTYRITETGCELLSDHPMEL